MNKDFKEWRANYQERVGQWVYGEGFWSVLRYIFLFKRQKQDLVRVSLFLFVRVCLMLFVFSFCGFGLYYLVLRSKIIESQIEESLSKTSLGSHLKALEPKLKFNSLFLSKLEGTGNSSTFFEKLELKNITTSLPFYENFSVLQGGPTSWRVGKAFLQVKTGEDSLEAAQKSYASLFEDFNIKEVDIEALELVWGYDMEFQGRISGAKAHLQFQEKKGWVIELNGGTFSYGYFKDWKLQGAQISISAQKGVLIERLELEDPKGGQAFISGSFGSGEMPDFTGKVEWLDVSLDSLLGESVQGFFSLNHLSQQGEVLGVLNSQAGLVFSTKIQLNEKNKLIIHNKNNELLNVLSYLDPESSYANIEYAKGSFILEMTQGSTRETLVREIDVVSHVPMETTITGSLECRPFTKQERESFLESYRKEHMVFGQSSTYGFNQSEFALRFNLLEQRVKNNLLFNVNFDIQVPASIKQFMTRPSPLLHPVEGTNRVSLKIQGRNFLEEIWSSFATQLRSATSKGGEKG